MLMRCLEEYDDNSIWVRPNRHTNSVANLMLHLEGNLGQYVLSSLGGSPDRRIRDEEFNARGGFSKAELINRMKNTIEAVAKTIAAARPEELLKVRMVQGFRLSGIGIVIHAVEHFSYHIGQIALWTKIRENTALGFYEGIDLNTLND